MKLLQSNSPRPEAPQCATIGFFDGIHLGHRALLRQLGEKASLLHQQTMAITFANHPQRFFHPERPFYLLTPKEEKEELLGTVALDHCLMLKFDAELKSLTSAEFLKLLHDGFNVQTLLIGYDHHFGSDREHGFEYYREVGEQLGVQVLHGECQEVESDIVSSSMIRRCLTNGEVEHATTLLGRPYTLRGMVVKGQQLGRSIGFPTANLNVAEDKLIPGDGVYAARVRVGERWFDGMLNIGNNPTVGNTYRSVEVHIINLNADLYDQVLEIAFMAKIRDEQRFASLDELKAQIARDKQFVVQHAKNIND